MLIIFALLSGIIGVSSSDSPPFLTLRRSGALVTDTGLPHDLSRFSQRRFGRSLLRSQKKVWIGCDEIYSPKNVIPSWNWDGMDKIVAKANIAESVSWPSKGKVWAKNIFASTDCPSSNGTSICSKVFPESQTETNSFWPDEALSGKTMGALKKSWKWLRRQLRITSKPFPPAQFAVEERTQLEEDQDDELKTKSSNSGGHWNGENEISSKTIQSGDEGVVSVDWPLDNQLLSKAVDIMNTLWFGESEVRARANLPDDDVANCDDKSDEGERMWAKTFSRFMHRWLWEKNDSIKTKAETLQNADL